jgi:hypothetical protein
MAAQAQKARLSARLPRQLEVKQKLSFSIHEWMIKGPNPPTAADVGHYAQHHEGGGRKHFFALCIARVILCFGSSPKNERSPLG